MKLNKKELSQLAGIVFIVILFVIIVFLLPGCAASSHLDLSKWDKEKTIDINLNGYTAEEAGYEIEGKGKFYIKKGKPVPVPESVPVVK